MFDFNRNMTEKVLLEFAEVLNEIQARIDFKVSARGWCYLMEVRGYITKAQFDRVEEAINKCRRKGIIPVDFVAEESSRAFSGIETASTDSIKETLSWMLEDVLTGYRHFTPDWLEGEEYYIQVLVEKVDLKILFSPVCAEYHIPIANSAGWSSILQRAEYTKRFRFAQERGLKCVLLYCGDHDPDGLRISETIRKNLEQLADVEWRDGTPGFDPKNLIVERFGLNYDFITQNNYSWIDNLITGAKKGINDLADPRHINNKLPYVQNYLPLYGARKCEANAMVTTPGIARQLMRDTIERFLGVDAKNRFEAKRADIQEKYELELEKLGLLADVKTAIRSLEN
jgi:hypothetical protein